MDVLFISVIITALLTGAAGSNVVVPFQQNYRILYGEDHVNVFAENNTVQLSLDQSSGSGFGSLKKFASGLFAMRIKLAPKDTSCIITSFYLTSVEEVVHHDEVDFEFYGGNSLPYELQTNIYAKGVGGREQKVALWFDPTADFHNYQILWNQHHIMFAVDGIPIRVFKNNTALGVEYPWRPMQVEATMWYADWACDVKPNLSMGPYVAEYQPFPFHIAGCSVDDDSNNGREVCYSASPRLWWNAAERWQLNPHQEQEYQHVRAKHTSYDYCKDRARYPVASPECQTNLSVL